MPLRRGQEASAEVKNIFMNTDSKPRPLALLAPITGFFVAVLLISNVVSTKIVALGPFEFDGGTLLFPLSYIFGDILTEVYGYRRARRVIWTGFASAALFALTVVVIGLLPSSPAWGNQGAYDAILGLTPRIILASLIAYLAGEFANSYILAKMKVAMRGRKLWLRTISSTLVGEGIDTVLFICIAFIGVFPTSVIISLLVANYLWKVATEVMFTPVTYAMVRFLKRHEQEDVYDTKTNFNPFRLRP